MVFPLIITDFQVEHGIKQIGYFRFLIRSLVLYVKLTFLNKIPCGLRRSPIFFYRISR